MHYCIRMVCYVPLKCNITHEVYLTCELNDYYTFT